LYIEVTVPSVNESFRVKANEKMTVEMLKKHIGETLSCQSNMYLLDMDEMQIPDDKLTLAQAGFCDATRLLYISDD